MSQPTIDIKTLFEFPASSIHYLTAQVEYWNAHRDGRVDRVVLAYHRGQQALRKLAEARLFRQEAEEARREAQLKMSGTP